MMGLDTAVDDAANAATLILCKSMEICNKKRREAVGDSRR